MVYKIALNGQDSAVPRLDISQQENPPARRSKLVWPDALRRAADQSVAKLLPIPPRCKPALTNR